MKYNYWAPVLFALVLSLGPSVTLGQFRAPNLGKASTFALFTPVGAVSNAGPLTRIIGDVGTDSGAMSGYSAGMIVGQRQLENDVTATASSDVRTAYAYLARLITTGPAIPPAMGHAAAAPQVLTPAIYSFGGAGSVGGLLILDGQNNANAMFVFQLGGALTVGAAAEVRLINGATPNHVFWQVNGAASIAADVKFAGIIIANGAVGFGDGAELQGKGLSTVGAVTTYNNIMTTTDSGQQPLPVELTSFQAQAQGAGARLQWTTASEKNSAYFAIERSIDGRVFTQLGRVAGQGTTSQAHAYAWTDTKGSSVAVAMVYYRLRQVDTDSSASYSPVRLVTFASATAQLALQAYPNPFQQQLGVRFSAVQGGVATLRLTNTLGAVVAERTLEAVAGNNTLALDPTEELHAGMYLLLLQQGLRQQTLRVMRE